VKIALAKQPTTKQQTSNNEMERLSYYLLHELQSEIDLGSKVAGRILYRAFARLEKEEGSH
jgi:hypothetical protein